MTRLHKMAKSVYEAAMTDRFLAAELTKKKRVVSVQDVAESLGFRRASRAACFEVLLFAWAYNGRKVREKQTSTRLTGIEILQITPL